MDKSNHSMFPSEQFDLNPVPFSHGQLYVALSRVRDCKNIAMYLTDEQLIVSDKSGHKMPTFNNVVYQDVLALNI